MGAEDENAFENGLNATQLQNVGSSLLFTKGLKKASLTVLCLAVTIQCILAQLKPNILTKY